MSRHNYGPSPILYNCRNCGARLETPATAFFARCPDDCTGSKPTFDSGDGLKLSFGEPIPTPLAHPKDGIYGFEDPEGGKANDGSNLQEPSA